MRTTCGRTRYRPTTAGGVDTDPVLFVIDETRPGVIHALTTIFGRRVGPGSTKIICQFVAAPAGLARLREIATSAEPWRSVITSHQMSGMARVGFLAGAHHLAPAGQSRIKITHNCSASILIVQAVTLGRPSAASAEPWMLKQNLRRTVRRFPEPTQPRTRRPSFELFRVIGPLNDRRGHEDEELVTGRRVPFRFQSD